MTWIYFNIAHKHIHRKRFSICSLIKEVMGNAVSNIVRKLSEGNGNGKEEHRIICCGVDSSGNKPQSQFIHSQVRPLANLNVVYIINYRKDNTSAHVEHRRSNFGSTNHW